MCFFNYPFSHSYMMNFRIKLFSSCLYTPLGKSRPLFYKCISVSLYWLYLVESQALVSISTLTEATGFRLQVQRLLGGRSLRAAVCQHSTLQASRAPVWAVLPHVLTRSALTGGHHRPLQPPWGRKKGLLCWYAAKVSAQSCPPINW